MDHRLSLTFVGTATVLLRWGAVSLLTDPNFLHRGQFAYLGKGLVSRRLSEPVVPWAELPGLSGVVLSHLHGDHFDRVARRRLDHGVPIVTTPHARRRLAGRYVSRYELVSFSTVPYAEIAGRVRRQQLALAGAAAALGGAAIAAARLARR